MCGIAGVFGAGVDAGAIARMTSALAHRGPDDDGLWIDTDGQIGLGHRRLAIVDVSAAGHQPMHSPSGRFVITFNGEIYNHSDLRDELRARGQEPEWRGHSDTETLLAAFDVWGIKTTLQRASGMFALALWDRSDRQLVLARDRLGEKPLYYGRTDGPNGPFLFASELKALHQHPAFAPEIDREALGLLIRYLAIPAPKSIYRGISKLLPGTFLTLSQGAPEPLVEPYWSGAEVARSGVEKRTRRDAGAAADELERVLERAVGRQMMSDVPLGAFLSGGVDSSTIVAIMQKLSAQPVKTFTIGFGENAFNEAPHAKAVARHLGTDHTELYVTPEQARDVIPALPVIYDEPFADSSQIPTYLVSALARREVTVALSGDGGDELFCGYPRYALTAAWWNRVRRIPMPMRLSGARALNGIPAGAWSALGERARKMLLKGASLLSSNSQDDAYDHMLSQWPDPGTCVIGTSGSVASTHQDALRGLDGIDRMMARDMLDYLPNDLLAKVDRAAMAVSLETRVPLLDPEVVEFAWRLPLELKISTGSTKRLLREVLYRHVPRELIERPKMGFGVPLDSWLRGPLRDWAENLLDERRLREDGYFHAQPVCAAWDQQLRGRDQSLKLWPILMFQTWLDAQADPRSIEQSTVSAGCR